MHSPTTRRFIQAKRAAAISAFISFPGGLASVLTSDGTLATVAAAMLVMLVRPRLRTRARPDMSAEMHAARTLGSTVFCFLGRDGIVVSITPNAREVLGEACDRAADLALSFADLIQPDHRTAVDDWTARAWLSEPPPPCVVPTRGPYAARRWLHLSTPGRVDLNGQAAVLVELREVTDQAEIHNHARLLARALDAGTDAAYITDLDGRLEYVNGAFESMFGYRSAEVLGRPVSLLSSGRHRPEFFSAMWQTLASGGSYTGELLNRRMDGALCTVDLTITRLEGDDTTPARYIAIARDITSRRRVEKEVEDLAYYDALTGLANHRLLRERARQILALVRRHGSSAALLHIDVADLRGVNAQHGRVVGDDLLRTVAERLKQGLRESDTLARMGGDEFLVLLSDATDEQSIARVVHRLQQSISQTFTLRDRAIDVSCRIGVALYPQDASSFDDLVGAAEVALRRAEQADTSFEFFERSVSAASHDRILLEEDLHWAWEHDQFVLHYQPIIGTNGEIVGAEALTRNEVVGVEALARWPHMERGLLQPSQFIPIAERTGRILSLDRWAIATAARQAVKWLETGWGGWVSVNLSARSLQDAELPEYVERTLEAHGLEPSRLVIEVTESAAMRDPTRTAGVLEALHRLGVMIALDDFGVGHSSLAYLKLFPVDLLKLDRCFIQGVGSDPREEQLIEIMISLAHRIGAKVVAEGVEEQGQMDWLRRAGCDYVQGFLIGRPAPPEAMPGTGSSGAD
ncbi:MAG TPA: EAL domain-containing protein [Longimicrobiales bacterium]|nr:EAL domain-containing protein [Longimicrobiales bacterium]